MITVFFFFIAKEVSSFNIISRDSSETFSLEWMREMGYNVEVSFINCYMSKVLALEAYHCVIENVT